MIIIIVLPILIKISKKPIMVINNQNIIVLLLGTKGTTGT